MSILRPIDIDRGSAKNLDAGVMKLKSQIVRRLAAHRDDYSDAALARVDIQHRLQADLIKIKPVAHVVIRAHSFWVTVQKDRTVSQLSERVRRIHATPIKLYRAADAVGARSEN